jgi:hypothetical protein
LDNSYKKIIKEILLNISQKGLHWKPGSLEYHTNKRINRKHLDPGTTEQQFEDLIISKIFNDENDIYFYFLEHFEQDYYVFTDQEWIIIIGKDNIMETAFKRKNVTTYLVEEDGYVLIGKLKEVEL